jgi:putative ABC transport system permease protein
LGGYTIGMNITSLFALLVAMFIIYNSFAIAVTQRRYEIGVLRALGATRGQIRTLFLWESALAGLVGSALGVAFGILLARGIMGHISEFLSSFYGVGQAAGAGLEVEQRLMAVALSVGVVTSMIAAWAPAHSAALVDPIVALQKGKLHAIAGKEVRLRWATALLLAAVAALCLIFGRYAGLFYFGYALTVVGAVLLTPALALWITRALRPLLRWLAPVEGTLAADGLIQAPRRTAATVAALMLSLALVVSIAGEARTMYGQILVWMNTTLNPDFFVTPSENLSSRTFRFPASLGDGLKTIEGIADVQTVRTPRIIFRGKPVLLVSVEMLSSLAHQTLTPVGGDLETMCRLAAEGKGVIVAENLLTMQRVNRDEIVEMATPSGLLKLPIVGVVRDYSDQQGTFFVDREVFQRHWRDDTANLFRVYLKPGASAAQVKERILGRYGGLRRLFVLSNIEVREYIMKLMDQLFAMTYAQIFVAVLVAVLGIVNTLTVSITDRRRELGVLRAVGALGHQIRHTIWMEAASMGLVGLVLGLVLGAVVLYYNVEVLRREFGGVGFQYVFPVETALVLLPVILTAAFVSALGPAESAVRGSLVEALEYE